MTFDFFRIKIDYLHRGEKPQKLCQCVFPIESDSMESLGCKCGLPFGKYGTRTNPFGTIREALDAAHGTEPQTLWVWNQKGRLTIHE